MSVKRKQYKSEYKFRVAVEALKNGKTISEIGSEMGVHPKLVGEWKRKLQEEGPSVFQKSSVREQRERESQATELYEQIGRLKMEIEWLKKKVTKFN